MLWGRDRAHRGEMHRSLQYPDSTQDASLSTPPDFRLGLQRCGIFDAVMRTMVHKEKRIMPLTIDIKPSTRVLVIL